MLKEISKSKYRLVAGDTSYDIVFSLGLKDALFDAISEVYQKFLALNPQDSLIPPEFQTKYADLQREYAEADDDDDRLEIYKKLSDLKFEMMTLATALATQQAQKVQDSMLAAIRQFKYDIWALLLSRRNLEGEVQKQVTVRILKEDPSFAEPEVEEALEKLLDVVLEMTAERLKKSLRTQQALLEVIQPKSS